MNKGDTLRIVLAYKLNNVDLAKDAYDEIELQFNPQSSRNAMKFLYSKEEIVWDIELSKYVVYLSQEQTFKLKDGNLDEENDIQYQIRLLIGSTLVSSDVGTFTLGPVLSKEILGD